MPILVNKTFEIVTEESAQHGDAEERGFVFEDVPHTFRELVALMRDHTEASQSIRDNAPDANVWFSSYPETDYRTGEEEATAIHYSRANAPRMAKYWAKAYRAAKARNR